MKSLLKKMLVVFAAGVPAWAANGIIAGDTYINSASPANNFGSLPAIEVANGSSALVQFSLVTLPPSLVAADISKATLILFANRVSAAGTVDLATVGAAWTELGVNASNVPALTPTGQKSAVNQSGEYIAFDVTGVVQNWIISPGLNNGFAILADSGTPAVSAMFDSKENTATSHPAALEITLVNTGLPGIQGPQGPPGVNGAPGQQGPAGPTDPKLVALSNLLNANTYNNVGSASASPGTPCVLATITLAAFKVGGGFLPANGARVQISQNPALFSILGTTFGGDGEIFFNLPDLRNITPAGMTYGICVTGIYPMFN